MNDIPVDLPATQNDRQAPPPVLLPYQRAWVEDDSALKVNEKSRRTGLTWAEAADDVLIAAAGKDAGGQNVYYIGYNQDMAIEYVEACAMWARAFDRAASDVEEGLWEDGGRDAEAAADKHIKTFTIRFPAAGHRIVALSSRPANLRGKQGVVVIDEAAFHDRLEELLKAALALLIWGGKVRVISTHNGDQNAFNELVTDIRAGRRRGAVHRIAFQEAVAQGLYERVCLRLGRPWSAAAEAEWVAGVYAFYGEAAREELDVVPSAGEGTPFARAALEAAMTGEPPVVRLTAADALAQQPRPIREAEIQDWCEAELAVVLAGLDGNLAHYFGEDFARSADLTSIWVAEEGRDLTRRTRLLVELRNVPFEQQRQILFYVLDRLPRFRAGAMDASGNGAYLAEVAMQRYGASRIAEVKLSVEWYRQHMPRLLAEVQDRTLTLPRDADVLADFRLLRRLNGVIQLPANARARGSDGRERHGDSAIAAALLLYAVVTMAGGAIEWTPAPTKTERWDPTDLDDAIDDLPSMETGAW